MALACIRIPLDIQGRHPWLFTADKHKVINNDRADVKCEGVLSIKNEDIVDCIKINGKLGYGSFTDNLKRCTRDMSIVII